MLLLTIHHPVVYETGVLMFRHVHLCTFYVCFFPIYGFANNRCGKTSRQDVMAVTGHQDSLRPGSAFLYRGEQMRFVGGDTRSRSQLMLRVVSTLGSERALIIV